MKSSLFILILIPVVFQLNIERTSFLPATNENTLIGYDTVQTLNLSDSLMAAGKSLELKRLFSEAISKYDSVLLLDPLYVIAHYRRAVCFIESGKYDKALKDLNYTIKNDNKHKLAYKERAWVHYITHKFDLALKDVKKYARLEPFDDFGWYLKGRIEKDQGNYIDAVKDLKKATELNNRNSDAYIVIGNIYKDRKKYNDAFKQYELAMEAAPLCARPYYYKGLLHLKMKDTLEALNNFEIAVREKDNDDFTLKSINYTLAEIGYFEKARANLETGLFELPSSDKLFELGLLNLYGQKYQDAISCFDDVIKIDSTNSDAFLYKGFAMINLGMKKEGRDYIKIASDMGNIKARNYIQFNKELAVEFMKELSRIVLLQ